MLNQAKPPVGRTLPIYYDVSANWDVCIDKFDVQLHKVGTM